MTLPQFGREPYKLVRLTPGVFGDASRQRIGNSFALPQRVGPGGSNREIFHRRKGSYTTVPARAYARPDVQEAVGWLLIAWLHCCGRSEVSILIGTCSARSSCMSFRYEIPNETILSSLWQHRSNQTVVSGFISLNPSRTNLSGLTYPRRYSSASSPRSLSVTWGTGRKGTPTI